MTPIQEFSPVIAAHTPFSQFVEIIAERIKGSDEVDKRAPGLSSLLNDIATGQNSSEDTNQGVTHVDLLRRLLRMYKEAPEDDAYQNVLKSYTEDEQTRIEKFVKGSSLDETDTDFRLHPSIGIRDEIRKLLQSKHAHIPGKPDHDILSILKETFELHNPFHGFVNDLSIYLKQDGQQAAVTVFEDALFQNWGQTVESVPQYTCIPSAVEGIQGIIKYAKQAGMNVRCAGFRHSWAPIFGRHGQILISTLPINEVTKLPNFEAIEFHESEPNGLQQIDIVEGVPRTAGNKLVRIGCAVTNERLRRWCVQGNQVSMPSNAILGETTIGGSNAPICHGAGFQQQTLSDIVRKIEFVDANGEIQSITDEKQLAAAAGSFGLLGVVTYLTLELVPMKYALMKPVKMPVMQAVPPPLSWPDSKIPKALFRDVSLATRRQWQEDFERRATSDYYAEWFWFPYLEEAWVNTWSTTDDPSDAVDFPMYGKIVLSWLGGFLFNVVQEATTLRWVGELVRTYATSTLLISHAAMALLPTTEVKTALPNALHFQRAVHNTRVRDVELEMPLPPKAGDGTKPDFEAVQTAWWDAILIAYEHEMTAPMRMPLEMRVIGNFNIILAPQRRNNLGTCCIEVLTLWSESKAWKPFAQQIVDKWMSYTDASGKPLRSRPHWAKEWADYNVNGKPWVEKLRDEDYRDEIREFKEVLGGIGKEQGWTLQDIQQRFSNDLFDYLIYSEPGSALKPF